MALSHKQNVAKILKNEINVYSCLRGGVLYKRREKKKGNKRFDWTLLCKLAFGRLAYTSSPPVDRRRSTQPLAP